MRNEFKSLVGFSDEELGYELSKKCLQYSNGIIRSAVNKKEYRTGNFEILSLAELRKSIESIEEIESNDINHIPPEKKCVKEVLTSLDFSDALFQVASQFNLLEMKDPSLTPENGVEVYWSDPTQGPKCAQAAIGATLYRNYFIEMPDGSEGQSAANQINCLDSVLERLNARKEFDWQYSNGYILITKNDFSIINKIIDECDEEELDKLRSLLKVGIHWNAEVNDGSEALNRFVTQIFCSALPLSYCQHYDPTITYKDGANLSKLILEATEEATILAGIINKQKTKSNKVVLTKIGGGAFGNRHEWIANATQRALSKYRNYGLNIIQYHYDQKQPCYGQIKAN